MKSSILFFSIKVVFVFAAVFQVNQLKAPFFGASEARVIFFVILKVSYNGEEGGGEKGEGRRNYWRTRGKGENKLHTHVGGEERRGETTVRHEGRGRRKEIINGRGGRGSAPHFRADGIFAPYPNVIQWAYFDLRIKSTSIGDPRSWAASTHSHVALVGPCSNVWEAQVWILFKAVS